LSPCQWCVSFLNIFFFTKRLLRLMNMTWTVKNGHQHHQHQPTNLKPPRHFKTAISAGTATGAAAASAAPSTSTNQPSSHLDASKWRYQQCSSFGGTININQPTSSHLDTSKRRYRQEQQQELQQHQRHLQHQLIDLQATSTPRNGDISNAAASAAPSTSTK
jgi:hypothetical protein